MNPISLTEGQLITCKEGYYLGTFATEPFSDFVSPYTPWLAISMIDFSVHKVNTSNNQWIRGEGEIIVYLGKRSTQLPLEIMHVTDNIPYKNIVQHHEVFWRGIVYRVRTSNFKRLKKFPFRVPHK